jgi:hypothetical protein
VDWDVTLNREGDTSFLSTGVKSSDLSQYQVQMLKIMHEYHGILMAPTHKQVKDPRHCTRVQQSHCSQSQLLSLPGATVSWNNKRRKGEVSPIAWSLQY